MENVDKKMVNEQDDPLLHGHFEKQKELLQEPQDVEKAGVKARAVKNLNALKLALAAVGLVLMVIVLQVVLPDLLGKNDVDHMDQLMQQHLDELRVLDVQLESHQLQLDADVEQVMRDHAEAMLQALDEIEESGGESLNFDDIDEWRQAVQRWRLQCDEAAQVYTKWVKNHGQTQHVNPEPVEPAA